MKFSEYENNLIEKIIDDHISQYDIIVNLCEDLGVCTPYQILRALKLIRDNKMPDLIKLPNKQSMKTLVMLENQSHLDLMFSKINEFVHKEIYKSWKNIRASLDKEIALQDKDPIFCGNGEIFHVYEAKDE